MFRTHKETFISSLGMTFNLIPAGRFIMGSPSDEPGHWDEEYRHQVTLTQSYYMQTTEVTQGQWKAVMGGNPSRFSDCGDDCPVESVSWNDVQTFIGKLNSMGRGEIYRLPTEAEWEYAARAGITTRFCFGDDDRRLKDYAWYNANSGNRTQPVAQKQPNAWGLYDMHGNVWEWVYGWHGSCPSGAVMNPTGPSAGSSRVLRGGSRYPGIRSHHNGLRLVLPQIP